MTADRPALVLVPGLLCDAEVWRHAIDPLAPRAAAWVADVGQHTSLGAMAEALLAQAPAARFALAGHSMGGRVALEVMRRAPERVSRLALLDTGWQPRPAGPAGAAEAAQRLALVALARDASMRALAERWAPGMLHPRRLGTPVHAAVQAMVERRTPQEFARQVQALLERPDAADVLDTIACPTLLVCGRDDAWSPLARHVQMAARIAGARLVVVDDCGHMSTLEQPEAVTAALAQWLETLATLETPDERR